MFLWTNLFSFYRQWMWSYALFIWTAVWKMISPLMISRKTAAHPTFTFCIALVIMTFFIPNKSHQLLKTRAVYSGGAGGVRAPPEFGGSKKHPWIWKAIYGSEKRTRAEFACYHFFRFQNFPISLAMRFLIASIQDENGGSSLTECENSLCIFAWYVWVLKCTIRWIFEIKLIKWIW